MIEALGNAPRSRRGLPGSLAFSESGDQLTRVALVGGVRLGQRFKIRSLLHLANWQLATGSYSTLIPILRQRQKPPGCQRTGPPWIWIAIGPSIIPPSA